MLPKTTHSPASSTTAESTASVLLVEDDEAVCTLLRRMLERGGFAVVTAINGREGVERFRERRVDIVITDMMMPEMSGDELIRSLLVERPGVRIIAISGIEYLHLRTALALGAKATLRKPIEADRLVETVRRVFAA